MHGLEMHLMLTVAMNFAFFLHMRSLFKAICYIEAIKYVYCLSYLIYIVPLLSGQPLLSGHFSKSRGWPLNRGRTVAVILLDSDIQHMVASPTDDLLKTSGCP